MAGIGLPELIVILLITVVPLWRILTKAGYSGRASLLAFVPGLNFLILLFLAFSKWPIEGKLERLQQSTANETSTM
ncbi:MAG: DUF805 domain-containing protein [Candidatus Aquicultor sp.]